MEAARRLENRAAVEVDSSGAKRSCERQGVDRLGVRVGNWLTVEHARRLLENSCPGGLRSKRNHAILAMLIGCYLRRGELLALNLKSAQLREEHWVIADLIGKRGRIRTVPIRSCVKTEVDAWTASGEIAEGRVFRSTNKAGKSGVTT